MINELKIRELIKRQKETGLNITAFVPKKEFLAGYVALPLCAGFKDLAVPISPADRYPILITMDLQNLPPA